MLPVSDSKARFGVELGTLSILFRHLYWRCSRISYFGLVQVSVPYSMMGNIQVLYSCKRVSSLILCNMLFEATARQVVSAPSI